MPVDTNWDIDYYKTDYESEEHWNLRRRFMEVHKDRFSEDELVCLAQVFINVEFMGCKYPDETMRLVGELSQEVAKEFRAERAKRLQRTFVKASDAAEARAKARRPQPVAGGNNDRLRGSLGGTATRKRFGDTLQSDTIGPSTANQRQLTTDLMQGMKYGQFIVYLVGGRNCLQVSGTKCSVHVQEKEVPVLGQKQFDIFIGQQLAGRAVTDNIKTAKAEAFENAMAELRKHCYFIKPNLKAESINVNKSNEKIVAGINQSEVTDKKLDSNNVGYKMMKMMGWSGGGLGSKTQGREDPVGYLLKTTRSGLGNTADKMDRNYFLQILKNYIDADDIRDLHFEATFTKEERALLHEIAGKLGLKSTSHGKAEARSLVISKKTITHEQILTEVLINQTPSYCNKYFVQVPPSKAKMFPLHTTQLEL